MQIEEKEYRFHAKTVVAGICFFIIVVDDDDDIVIFVAVSFILRMKKLTAIKNTK